MMGKCMIFVVQRTCDNYAIRYYNLDALEIRFGIIALFDAPAFIFSHTFCQLEQNGCQTNFAAKKQ